MKKLKILNCFILAGIVFSSTAFANVNPYNDPEFNPDEQISLTQQESQEINVRLGADKASFEESTAKNERRNRVIETCGQYLDDQYSDASVAKTKECLRINDGYFPVEYQMQPNTPVLAKPVEAVPYQQQQLTNQPSQKKEVAPATPENKPNDDYLFGVLR